MRYVLPIFVGLAACGGTTVTARNSLNPVLFGNVRYLEGSGAEPIRRKHRAGKLTIANFVTASAGPDNSSYYSLDAGNAPLDRAVYGESPSNPFTRFTVEELECSAWGYFGILGGGFQAQCSTDSFSIDPLDPVEVLRVLGEEERVRSTD